MKTIIKKNYGSATEELRVTDEIKKVFRSYLDFGFSEAKGAKIEKYNDGSFRQQTGEDPQYKKNKEKYTVIAIHTVRGCANPTFTIEIKAWIEEYETFLYIHSKFGGLSGSGSFYNEDSEEEFYSSIRFPIGEIKRIECLEQVFQNIINNI